MDDFRFESLTKRERECLLLVDRETATGDIAAQLGLSAASVETYLKRAREKLGANSRFIAARALRSFEARHQSQGPRELGLSAPPACPSSSSSEQGEWEASSEPTFAEQRQTFDHFAPIEREWQALQQQRSLNGASPFQRLMAIVGLIFVIVLILLLAFPLSESFQRLANIIDPISH